MAAAAAAALAPATSLRFKPYVTLWFFSFYPTKFHKTRPFVFPPILPRDLQYSCGRRGLCSVISGALRSGEAVDRTKPEFFGKWKGERVGGFRKKLRIAEVKGGPDEGLDRLGQTLVVQGWVRTIRVQSSVTFIEVTPMW